jgi:peptidoglycan/LPS O-acetylase OafA/YrhL
VYVAALLAGAIHIGDFEPVVAILIGALLLEGGRAGKLRDWLNWRPLQFLGRTSYSLYLVHNAATSVTLAVLHRLTPDTTSWELSWLLVVLVSTCVAAWLFWRLVERPCIILSRDFRPSTSPA